MKHFLFLGDSITDCGHSFDYEDMGEGFVRMIYNAFHLNNQKVLVLNRGTDGFTVKNVKRFWDFSHTKYKPDCINILVGINDIAVMKCGGFTTFEKTYDELLTAIRKNCDCPITLMEPFIFPHPAEYITWEGDVRNMSECIQSLAKKHSVVFLPLWDKLLKAAEKDGYDAITTDGIHLTKKGQKIIADTWLEWYRL